jgi:hypothetical protein
MTPADVLAKFTDPITDATRRDMHNREFLNQCEAPRGGRSLTLSLVKVPQDPQTDQTMRHRMCGFSRRAARKAGDYREHLSDEPGRIQIQEAAQESTEAPFYEVHQLNPVNRYSSIIERAARRFEVEKNIRAGRILQRLEQPNTPLVFQFLYCFHRLFLPSASYNL